MLNFEYFLPYLSTVVTTILVFYIQRRQNRRDALSLKLQAERDATLAKTLTEQTALRAEIAADLEVENQRRSEARRQESIKALNMMRAIGNLSLANSIAIKEGRVNGEMTAAIAAFKQCSAHLDEFLQSEATAHYAVKGD